MAARAAVLCCRSLLVTAFACAIPAGAEQTTAAGEVSTRDEPALFQSRVHLVLAPVVVRDAQGRAIGTLTKDNFQLFDKGKSQTIIRFSVEKSGTQNAGDAATPPAPEGSEVSPDTLRPQRFIAYLFDDIHLKLADVVHVRAAAERQIGSLDPRSRAAIYTSSGQGIVDFTDDPAQLAKGLARLQPRPASLSVAQQCPPMTYYIADQIENKNDDQALGTAVGVTVRCMALASNTGAKVAEALVHQAARQALSEGGAASRAALRMISDLIRRMAVLPGSRTIVFVSPGFILLDDHRSDETAIIERATQAHVVVNTIDARGLYTVDIAGDIAEPVYDTEAARLKANYERLSASTQGDVLAEIAEGTGGYGFHNNNSMEAAFHRTAGAPEYVYMLGFSPQNLKYDGQYHSLKVTVRDVKNVSVQARRGYYAPREAENAAETARREVEEALFSRDELRDIPVEVVTQFFKTTEFDAKLAVVARVDVKGLPFRKLDGRNGDELTVVTGLFDRNGNFVTGTRKVVTMRLRDETLAKRIGSGLSVKANFEVKAGGYAIRVVLRDAEGRLMSARNSAVEIP